MTESEMIAKRRFWRRVLIAGILILVISLLTLVSLYLSGMADVKAKLVESSELELEIALLSARNQILFTAVKWTLPIALAGSLMMNLARYQLRKLKKLKNL
jgi:magnesium-transporting ATPase (P-type)